MIPCSPLSQSTPTTNTVVSLMESTAGFPHGLEAGAFNLKRRGTAIISQHFLLTNHPVGSVPRDTLRLHHSVSSITYCPALYQTIKGKSLSPSQKWQKYSKKKKKERDHQSILDQLQIAKMINHSNTVQLFKKHCLSTKIHYGKTLSEQLWREYVIHLSVQHFWKTVKQNKLTLWSKQNLMDHCPCVRLAEKKVFRKSLNMHPLRFILYSDVYVHMVDLEACSRGLRL